MLEIGSDGKNKTTCVVDRPDGSDEELVDQGKLSLTQALFMRDLKDALAADGTDPEAGYTLSGGRKVVLASTFYARLRKGWTFRAPETDQEGRAKEFQAMLVATGKLLKAKGYIDRDNDKRLIWWTGKDDRVRVTQKPTINPELKKEFPNLGKEELPF